MAQRILIVDDDPKIVRLLRASLEQAGYRVFVAYDGETALHTLRRERPDLVVLDLMLPDRDGWDVTRVMRADAAWRIHPSSCSPPASNTTTESSVSNWAQTITSPSPSIRAS